MLARLLPEAVATAETRAELLPTALFPEEERAVAAAGTKRRNEFTSGRACARAALAQLGVAAVAIAVGADGEPCWPPGIVGSITHCRGFRACAAARAERIAALGIDAEEDRPIGGRLLRRIASDSELALVRGLGSRACADKLLFCCKEAAFKLLFALARTRVSLMDVEVELSVGADGSCGAVEVRVTEPRARDVRRWFETRGSASGRASVGGRWCSEDGTLCAALWLPAGTR